jgi:transposase-like protein
MDQDRDAVHRRVLAPELAATRRFFARALKAARRPTEVSTDRAPTYPRVLAELVPQACHVVGSTPIARSNPDRGRLRARAPTDARFKELRNAQVVCGGHAFVQNLRRGHNELGRHTEPGRRLEVIFTELALAI